MHFGIITPPVPGHIHPFGALGRELMARGHRVTILQMSDIQRLAHAQGLEFQPLGQSDHPAGSLPESLAQLGRLEGLRALRFTISAITRTTEMICRDAPAAILKSGIDTLLVDQTEPAGGTVAQHLGLPFVTICNALALNHDNGVPPPFTAWQYRPKLWASVRNRLGYAVFDRIMHPVERVVSEYRKKWGLPALDTPEGSFSRLAQISQQPAAFDFPRQLPPNFHYVGPLRNPVSAPIAFPWEKLDGRPLIYASLGTLQNGKEKVFRCFAEACLGLNVQLVITHGGGLDEKAASSLPGKPLVVGYAPQLDVLLRATLTLTHAGLNTVLDSLKCGVPLVAVPITYEQPAIASRLRWTGTGKVLPFRKLNVERLRRAIECVLSNSSYSYKAQTLKDSIAQAGGVGKAADIIEKAVGCSSGTKLGSTSTRIT
jgi:zeaxanthin glucosyltransferase